MWLRAPVGDPQASTVEDPEAQPEALRAPSPPRLNEESMRSGATTTALNNNRRYKNRNFTHDLAEDMPEDLITSKASEFRMQNAFATWSIERGKYEFQSLWATSARQLGVHGVGVQLYFEYHLFMIAIFCMFSFLAFPQIVMSSLGSYVELEDHGDPYYKKLLAFLSVANLGWLSSDASHHSLEERYERPLCEDCAGTVEDVAFTIGFLDTLSVLLFVLACQVFQHIWIPHTVRAHDEINVTAADFAVQVTKLPKRLGAAAEHRLYAEKLRAHFEAVLQVQLRGTEDEGCTDRVTEVTLVREYDGCIRSFLKEGYLLKQQRGESVKQARATEAGKPDEAAKAEQKAKNIIKKVDRIEASLDAQASMEDQDRDVCCAFVMFQKEAYKELVLDKYRFSVSTFFRHFQKKGYRFLDHHKIKVKQACEPSELFWENLDISNRERKIRKGLTYLVIAFILFVSACLMVHFQAIPSVRPKAIEASRWWRFKRFNANETMPISALQISSSAECSFGSHVIWLRRGDWGLINISLDVAQGITEVEWHLTENFLDLNFTEPVIVRCIRLYQPIDEKADKLKIYTCRPESNTQLAELTDLGADHMCTRMMDLYLTDTNNNETHADSGDRRIRMDDQCLMDVSLEAVRQAKKELGEKHTEDVRVVCFCRQQLNSIGALFKYPPHDTEEEKACADWSSKEVTKEMTYIAGICVITILNQILWIIFDQLDKWTRYRTISSLAVNSMRELFFAQFCNTGLLYVLVSIYWGGANFSVFGMRQFLDGPFDDFTVAWHTRIGSAFVVLVLGQVVSNLLLVPFTSFVVTPLYVRFYKSQAVTEELRRDLVMLPEFPFVARLAATNVIMFCIVMYGPGTPILYFLGIVYCFLSYWIDKYCLLKGSCKPPAYSGAMVSKAIRMAPYAAFLHTCIACFMFGYQTILPSGWSYMTNFAESVCSMKRGPAKGEYDWLMELYLNSDWQTRVDYHYKYYLARCLDMSRVGPCLLFQVLMFFFPVALLIHVFKRYLLMPCTATINSLKQEVIWKGKKKFAERASKFSNIRHAIERIAVRTSAVPTTQTFDEAKELVTGRGELFSYELSASERYKDAWEALSYEPEYPLDKSDWLDYLHTAVGFKDAAGEVLAKIREISGERLASGELRNRTSPKVGGE